MDSSENSRPRTRSGIIREKPNDTTGSKIESALVGLPDGWIKETRPRKGASGAKQKTDPFYIDPKSGYEFRSLKDVQRYIETGDITKCAMRPHKRKIDDLHIAENTPPAGTSSQHTQLDAANNSSQSVSPPTALCKAPLGEALIDAERGTDVADMPSSEPKGINLIQPEADKVDASKNKNSTASLSANHTSEKSGPVAGNTNVDLKPPKEKKRRTKSVKQVTTPLRASPRLAAIKVNQETHDEPQDQSSSADIVITGQLQPNQVEAPRPEPGSTSVPERKDGAAIAGTTATVENRDSSVPEQKDGAPTACSSAKVESWDVPAEQPVPPTQAKPVEAATDKSGSALSSIFGHAWSDPCIEFAFKTLTGDIPILDDTAAVADYFHQPLDSNKSTTADFSSSLYDSSRNHAQGDHVGLPMPRPSDKFRTGSWFPPQ